MMTFYIEPKVSAACAGLFNARGTFEHAPRNTSSHELIFVRKGTLKVTEGDRYFELDKDDYLILSPTLNHNGRMTNSEELEYYWLNFEIGADGASRGGARFKFSRSGHVGRPDHLTFLMRRFLDDQEAQVLSQASANALVELILLEISEHAADENWRDVSAARLVDQAITYIRSNLSGELTTASVARAQRCNPDYLGRAFKRACGLTITETIHRQRIDLGKRLLVDGSSNIDQIAMLCGFSDPAYFRRIFKRYVGISPSAFRDLHQRQHSIREIRHSLSW